MTVTIGEKGPVDLPTVTSIRYPGSFRVEVTTPAGPLVQVFQNGAFWVQDGRGVHDAPPSVAEEMRANVQRDSIGLLLGLVDGKIDAARMPDVQFAGRSMPALKVTGAGMPPVTLIFDPSTALIVGQRYAARANNGTTAETEEEFSDFRSVGGIKVPFRAVVRVAGQVAVRRTLRHVEYNVPIDAAVFARPS
jgi:hypothetical protein